MIKMYLPLMQMPTSFEHTKMMPATLDKNPIFQLGARAVRVPERTLSAYAPPPSTPLRPPRPTGHIITDACECTRALEHRGRGGSPRTTLGRADGDPPGCVRFNWHNAHALFRRRTRLHLSDASAGLAFHLPLHFAWLSLCFGMRPLAVMDACIPMHLYGISIQNASAMHHLMTCALSLSS